MIRFFITNETNLSEDFRNKFQDKLKKDVRGFGYWCWKPQIILQALNSIDMGDIIHYADIGCHLNIQGRERLLEYFEICQLANSGILSFQDKFIGNVFFDNRVGKNLGIERKLTKGDLLDYFNVRHNQEIVDTPQIGATTMFIKKTPLSMCLVTIWIRTFSNNFNLIDDTISASHNLEGFLEHKHDQSIWSILTKLNNVDIVSYFETQYPLIWSSEKGIIQNDYELMQYYPIWSLRDKQ
jgi:hypothetical protein